MSICAECLEEKNDDELFVIQTLDFDGEILICEDCLRRIESGDYE